ncbi:transposase [Trabulsiella odontotermitis]|nr:transposase [Trabulsiella odontotermitis]
MCEKEPELKITRQLALDFYRLLKTKNKPQLNRWFTRVNESGSAELRRVAAGGGGGGHVSRLKMLKRQMYGRARSPLA